ncbi:putative RNA-directed DNA polymerase [Tanacetum coccineum]
MPPRMTTRSAGRATAAPRGGRTGERIGRGGGRTRGRTGDQGNSGIDEQGGQVGGRGNEKEFLACNPKEYDGKGGSIVYTRWIEKMKSVQDISGCEDNQKVKCTAGSFVGFMSWLGMVAATEPITIQRAMQKARTLTDKAVRNVSLMKNPKKRGNGGDPNRDRNTRDKNKRTRTGNAFATTTNPACFNCGCPGHMAEDCRVAPRKVNPMNARNPTAAPGACYEYGGTDHFKAACPRRAFMLGGKEACQDPNIMTGIEPSDLGFSYEIEIASGQLVEIDKAIRGCKLEIKVRNVSEVEVKDAMFSMGNEKSPGPDGYTAAFFKDAWDVVGNEVVAAVREFFSNGNLLKELNHTVIALIPKTKNPTRVTDYRPISCCNVLFKCISKIIANRIKESLKVLISPNQSAFVPGRSIADNVLLTQELMHNYHLDRGVPRCAFKVDIQKAYDTVDWDFLKQVLLCFGFHVKMVDWIMECVSTTSFSISINGSLHGYFKGRRGLRQGDPLSPYLFTMVMEVLTLIFKRRVQDSLIRLRFIAIVRIWSWLIYAFADDLFLFAHGDVSSATVIMEALEEFKQVSGLVPSLPKSTAYFCNVLNHIKLAILQILPFAEGHLPVKYLGVPLVSSRLVFRDCKELIEKVECRINDWKNKSLSIAGRLQLIQSVISSMNVYWASMFILPTRVLLDIEQLMRGFLWCQGILGRGKAKVAWEVVCLPKEEGGLGIKRLADFNKALMTSHIWKLLSKKDSLWVKWIHTYKLRDRNFWEIPCRGNMTWGWRNILRLRPIIREFFWYKIGDGSDVSVWFDQWCNASPLDAIVSSRDMYRAGLSRYSKVSDVYYNGTLVWPADLLSRYPILHSIPGPSSSFAYDQLEWRNRMGLVKLFSVNEVWQALKINNVESGDTGGSLLIITD